MTRLPVHDLTKVRDLEYFEGPLLSEFKTAAGDVYLYLWRDSDDECNRWMVFRSSRREVTVFLSGEVTIRQLIEENRDGLVYLVDLDDDANPRRVAWAFVEQLPPEYLPGQNSFHNTKLEPKHGDPSINARAILLQGEIDFQSLSDLPRKYRDVYTFQYLLGPDHLSRKQVPDWPFNYRMQGGYVHATFFRELYKSVPSTERPRLDAVYYASPGVIDMRVNNEVALLVVSTVRSFEDNADELRELYKELDRYVNDRTRGGKSTKKKTPQVPPPSEKEAESMLSDMCKLLDVDYPYLKQACEGTRQRAQIVLSFFRRVDSLVKYQAEGIAKIV